MYQIAITPVSERNTRREYRKSFDTKREANKWFNVQQAKRATARNFGASFCNHSIEVNKLY